MATNQIDRALIADLTAREEKRLEDQSPKSYAMFQRAIKHMPMGVASTYHARDPYPVYYTHGKGPHIWTVDGQEIADFHNGYGCMVQGHAHPLIVEAIQKRAPLGTQFGLPTEDAIIMAEHLAGAFKLPQWRFVNSGSEATMDAIRVARGFTGREPIVKMFGSYHGHHDYVMVSLGVADFGEIGPRDNYKSISYGAGIPQCSIDLTVPVPFNDVENMNKRIERMVAEGNTPAALIMEPAMMNLGVVLPEPGFLEGVRAITKKHGIVLIFDEVKTGICTARGGAVERWGVVPDMICLGKAVAGGTPCGAIGGNEEIMARVNDGTVFQVGTYSGNPLSMAAARASFEQVMTDDAYKHLNYLNDRIIAGCDAVCAKYGFPAYTVGISSKGCVNFADGKITDYESFIKHQDHELVALAWLYNFNRGIVIAPGREEEWTLSITHTDADIDLYVSAFDDLIRDVSA
ncbi:MAG TPA: aspartate aminotransferase family protein [Thermoleophilia bacterium]